jgi:hypothetical protein
LKCRLTIESGQPKLSTTHPLLVVLRLEQLQERKKHADPGRIASSAGLQQG